MVIPRFIVGDSVTWSSGLVDRTSAVDAVTTCFVDVVSSFFFGNINLISFSNTSQSLPMDVGVHCAPFMVSLLFCTCTSGRLL